MVIDNQLRYSLLFFYRIPIRLYFFTIDFQPWVRVRVSGNTFKYVFVQVYYTRCLDTEMGPS